MLHWLLFVLTAIIAYSFLAVFGKITGGTQPTLFQSVVAMFKPLPFLVFVIGNIFWVAAVFYGFRNTQYALPISMAIGILTSFGFSIVALGATVTAVRLIGLALVIIGIYLLR